MKNLISQELIQVQAQAKVQAQALVLGLEQFQIQTPEQEQIAGLELGFLQEVLEALQEHLGV